MSTSVEELVADGAIGGRTVQIVETGEVECVTYPVAPLPDGCVRVRTVRSAISPGTEMTFYGRTASNVHLHRHWNAALRIFEGGPPMQRYPITFGYRAVGTVVESRSALVAEGTRIWGSWRHTEFTALLATSAARQPLPDVLTDDDGVDIGHMGPICLNAVLAAEGEHTGTPVVVVGAGPIGLITAQLARATGASTVIVVDRLASRLRIAADLGFDPMETSPDGDVAADLKRRYGADGIPVAFECSGSTPALHEAIRVVRRRGAVVAVGFYQGDARGLSLGEEFHHNGVRIVSAQIGNVHRSTTREALSSRTLELAARGELILGGLPRLTLPVEQAAAGFAALSRSAEVLQVGLAYRS